MRIGELRERVTFKERVDVTDAGGGRSTTWGNISTDPTVWAKVMPVKGREETVADKVTKRQTYLVTVRHRTDLNTKMRVVWGAINLNILSIENRDMRKRFTTLECEIDG